MFKGFPTDPGPAALGMLACAAVARARYYIPVSVIARFLADPVVTSNGDRLRFESFSGCCGVHARLDLLPSALAEAPVTSGTTNVDFNAPMRAALAGVAGGGPLLLRVGADEVAVTTLDASVIERKVPLPDRWLRDATETDRRACAKVLRPLLGGPDFSQLSRIAFPGPETFHFDGIAGQVSAVLAIMTGDRQREGYTAADRVRVEWNAICNSAAFLAASLGLTGGAAAAHIAAAAAGAFGHRRPDVQEAALRLIARYGLPEGPERLTVVELAARLAPALDHQATALGLPGRPPAVTAERPIEVPRPRVKPSAGDPLPPPLDDPSELVVLLTRLMEDASDALSAGAEHRLPVLAPTRAGATPCPGAGRLGSSRDRPDYCAQRGRRIWMLGAADRIVQTVFAAADQLVPVKPANLHHLLELAARIGVAAGTELPAAITGIAAGLSRSQLAAAARHLTRAG